jgi:hypothetical protein
MNFLEKDLEDIIYENLYDMESRGLTIDSKLLLRQVNLGDYGYADLVGIHYNPKIFKTFYIEIFELKKEVIDCTALMQVCRYATAIKQMAHELYGDKINIKVRKILIGSDIQTKGDFVFLLNSLSDTTVYTYEYKFDGIWFNELAKTWRKTDSKVNNKSNEVTLGDVRDFLSNEISNYRHSQSLIRESV